MIESIGDPFSQLLQTLGRESAKSFIPDGGNLVANAKMNNGLRARVTLHPYGGNFWQLFLEKQQEANYDNLVHDDILIFQATKRGGREAQDFLEMHGVELVPAEKE